MVVKVEVNGSVAFTDASISISISMLIASRGTAADKPRSSHAVAVLQHQAVERGSGFEIEELMLRLSCHALKGVHEVHSASGLAALSLEQLLRRLQCASVTNISRHHTNFLAGDKTVNVDLDLVRRLEAEASRLRSKRSCDSTDVMHASLIASNVFRLGIGASTPDAMLPGMVVEAFLQIAQQVTEQHRGVPVLRLFRRSIDVELESQMDMAWTRVLESITPSLLQGPLTSTPPHPLQPLRLGVVAQCVAALQRSATWGATAARPADDPVNLVVTVFLLRCSNFVVRSQGTIEAEAVDGELLVHQIQRMLRQAQHSISIETLELRDLLPLAFALHDFTAVQRDALRHSLVRDREFLAKKNRPSTMLSQAVEWAELWMGRMFAALPGKLMAATLSELTQMLQLGVEAAPHDRSKVQLQLVTQVSLVVERMSAVTIVDNMHELVRILHTSVRVDGATYLAKTVLSKIAMYPHVLIDAEARALPTDNIKSGSLLVRVVSVARTSALLQPDRSDAFVLGLMDACGDISSSPEQEIGLLTKICVGYPNSAVVLERILPRLYTCLEAPDDSPVDGNQHLGMSPGAFNACAVCIAVNALTVWNPPRSCASDLLEVALRAAAHHTSHGAPLATEPQRMLAASLRSIPRSATMSPTAAEFLCRIRRHCAVSV